MKSFRDIETAVSEVVWFENIENIARSTDPICQNWLSYSGWMTDKLKKDFPEHTINVTRESITDIPLMLRDLKIEAVGLTREIEISVANNISIYAQTFAPNTTLNSNPWLRELGNNPLGGKLSLIEGIKRTDFAFASIDVGKEKVLCRRSSFEINLNLIHLVEAFPPRLNVL